MMDLCIPWKKYNTETQNLNTVIRIITTIPLILSLGQAITLATLDYLKVYDENKHSSSLFQYVYLFIL